MLYVLLRIVLGLWSADRTFMGDTFTTVPQCRCGPCFTWFLHQRDLSVVGAPAALLSLEIAIPNGKLLSFGETVASSQRKYCVYSPPYICFSCLASFTDSHTKC